MHDEKHNMSIHLVKHFRTHDLRRELRVIAEASQGSLAAANPSPKKDSTEAAAAAAGKTGKSESAAPEGEGLSKAPELST